MQHISEDIEANVNKISINEVLIDLERNIPTEVITAFEHALKYNQKPPMEEILFSVWKRYKNQIVEENEQNSILLNDEVHNLSLTENLSLPENLSSEILLLPENLSLPESLSLNVNINTGT